MKRWHVYEVSPIDYEWSYPQTVRQVAARMAALSDTKDVNDVALKTFLADWEKAKALAKSKGWEGDFRNEPIVFWLPMDMEFGYGFVLKQDNNGDTFIVSPTPLGWIKERFEE